MSENNDTSNESNSLGSDSIMHASRLAGGALTGGGGGPTGGGGNAAVLRSGVLRPSLLGPSVLGAAAKSGADSTTSAGSTEVAATNPFLREHEDESDATAGAENSEREAGAAGGAEVDARADEANKPQHDDEEPDERPDPLTMLRKNGLERANLFAAAKNSIPRVEKSGFVFGQNVHERVITENMKPDSTSGKADAADSSNELLFAGVIQNAAKATPQDGSDANAAAGGAAAEPKSLTEVAREYEESRAQKRRYEEVETFTGEEDERNIVDINCKLFAFVNSNWEERGRGGLRLNDAKSELESSRVVFRTAGNLRLLLNTKIWAGMVAERPSQKSLRLTAMDNTGKIKIFLVMSRPVDINQLHKALTERIAARKLTHPEECNAEHKNGALEESKNGATAPGDDVASVIVPHVVVEDDDAEEMATPTVVESDNSEDGTFVPKKKAAVYEN